MPKRNVRVRNVRGSWVHRYKFDNHLIINLYELLKDSSDPKDYPNPKNNYLSGKVNTNLHNLVQVY